MINVAGSTVEYYSGTNEDPATFPWDGDNGTNTTGKQVSEATGLPIKRYLSGRGGAEQILALLSCNEVDVLLFFRDPINPKSTDVNDMNLLRLCDVHNVPVATNIATAEALILALERGDLDWREVGNPSI